MNQKSRSKQDFEAIIDFGKTRFESFAKLETHFQSQSRVLLIGDSMVKVIALEDGS